MSYIHDMGSVIFKQSRSLIWVISTRSSISCNSHSCKRPFKTAAVKLGILEELSEMAHHAAPRARPSLAHVELDWHEHRECKPPTKRQEALQPCDGCRLPTPPPGVYPPGWKAHTFSLHQSSQHCRHSGKNRWILKINKLKFLTLK